MITAGDRQRRAGTQGQAQTNREEVTHNEGETGLASRPRPGETPAVTGTRFEQNTQNKKCDEEPASEALQQDVNGGNGCFVSTCSQSEVDQTPDEHHLTAVCMIDLLISAKVGQ